MRYASVLGLILAILGTSLGTLLGTYSRCLAQETERDVPAQTENSTEGSPESELNQEANQARIKELLSLVSDNTLLSHKRESPAYFALLKELMRQTPEELRSKARDNPRFNDFYSRPAEHRGEIVHLALNLRRVLPIDLKSENEAGLKRLYELWGWTDEAKAWMYCCVTPELPDGIPVGEVQHRIEITGYFFKMQAYQRGDAGPNEKNLVAPLVIGRVVSSPKAAAADADALNRWPLYLISAFGMLILFRLVLRIRSFTRIAPTHRNYRRRSLEPVDPENIAGRLTGESGLKIRNANE